MTAIEPRGGRKMWKRVPLAALLAIGGCAGSPVAAPDPIVATVDANGKITVDGEVVQLHEVRAALARALGRRQQAKE